MECFLKRVLEGKGDADSHRYFMRFGKGDYARRFLISFNKGKKIKIKGSFEWANDFVRFVKHHKNLKFSGKVLSREKIAGLDGRKKAGVFAYEIENSPIEEFENAYFLLLNANDSEIVLKIKKSLPKPGKAEEKIDDSFCSLEIDAKYWDSAREAFFWDVPEGKKCIIEHEVKINDIVMPEGEKDPVKIRELAKRKGVIIRKIELDGKEIAREHHFSA